MDTSILLWILGGQLALIAGLFKLWWDHTKDCREHRAEVASLKADVKHIVSEIGDHEHGIRGSLHELRNKWSGPLAWAQRKMEREE